MQTKFMIVDGTVQVVQLDEERILDTLPPKVYAMKFHPQKGFYLDSLKDQLELPSKIYGETKARVDKCIKTYRGRSDSTGILMTGDKGTGKTLLMSLLCNKVIRDLNLPVILIREGFEGDNFTSFIESLGECALVFDEFGKMYGANERHEGPLQKSLLSLMDGVDKVKRLLILTENNEIDINDFMLNRPSRIFYHFRYHKLEEASILGYCSDLKVGKKATSDIIELSRQCRIFSFDMLQSIVEEHLRFESPVKNVITDLNIDLREEYSPDIEILKVVIKATGHECEVYGSPIISEPDNYGYVKIQADGELVEADEDEEYYEFSISRDQIVYSAGDQTIYETAKYTVATKPVIKPVANYKEMLAY